MRIFIVLILMIMWVGGGCALTDKAYRARLVRLIEVKELMEKGVENYNSKEFYDKEIEQLDRRYARLESRWDGYA